MIFRACFCTRLPTTPLVGKGADAALQELIAKYSERGAYQIAQVCAFRKQSDEAFLWLDRAYVLRDGELSATKVDPILKSLHADPRYARS